MSPKTPPTFPLSGNPLKLAKRLRLAGFEVKHARQVTRAAHGGALMVWGRRQGLGLVSARVIWPAQGDLKNPPAPIGFVRYAGWWEFPKGYTAIIDELDRELTPLDV